MFHNAVSPGQPIPYFGRLVVERTHSSAIRDVPALINNVEALRPRCISIIRSIAHVIHAKRQWVFESLCKVIGDGHPLFQRFWLRVAHVIFHVGLHLPFVGGMRLAHINGEEIGVVLIVVVNLHHVANLAPKRRSSKTPKDENEWPRSGSFPNMEAAYAIEFQNPRIRRIIANLQRAAVHMWQSVAHHAVRVLRTSRHVGKDGECRNQQHAKNPRHPFPKTFHAILLQINKLCHAPNRGPRAQSAPRPTGAAYGDAT
jgi:hypothetical protein